MTEQSLDSCQKVGALGSSALDQCTAALHYDLRLYTLISLKPQNPNMCPECLIQSNSMICIPESQRRYSSEPMNDGGLTAKQKAYLER